jgi:hypothetical protein
MIWAVPPPDGARVLAFAVLAAAAILVAGSSERQARAENPRACSLRQPSREYVTRVDRALRAKQDIWGNALLRAPEGPTYAAARRYLTPLLLARAAKGRPLTVSGVHYVPFAQPGGPLGAGSVALHVADGSQILSDRAEGPNLSVNVGEGGRERYGSCRTRLSPAALYHGYLPILETRYVDETGARYRQESFAARIAETRSLVSFVRLEADAPRSGGTTQVRLTPSVDGLSRTDDRLVRSDDTYVFFSPGATWDGSSLTYAIAPGSRRTLYAAWVTDPSPARALALDQERHEAVRESVIEYWERRLAEGATIVVPERRVLDAERSLLIQNLVLSWRYSVGNAYEEFSFPEGIDVAQVMGEQGFEAVAAAILRNSLPRRLAPYPNWKMGEKLVGSAAQFRLFRDRRFVEYVTPALQGYVGRLGRQIERSSRGLLDQERYSSDIVDSVLGLHSQAVVWQGLRSMGDAWARTGYASLADTCRRLAARLERGLRQAVRGSQKELRDGSLFIPVRLLDDEGPYETLTESRPASYWNLVMPYALASGLFAPKGLEAAGVLRYMLRHGSRLLGLVRAGAFALYGPHPSHPTSGTDEVYGVNMSRFLADNDQPDQLVLSLYGQLAAAMAPGTFVSGEGASVAPLGRDYYRAMYLPPNGASNAAFLETLRLMLAHETADRNGRPRGLEIAYATPRGWLRPGRRILVRGIPTSFGPLSFSITAAVRDVRVSLALPDRVRPHTIGLRLRMPTGVRIKGVSVDGRAYHRFDAARETIDLSGRVGTVEVVARKVDSG